MRWRAGSAGCWRWLTDELRNSECPTPSLRSPPTCSRRDVPGTVAGPWWISILVTNTPAGPPPGGPAQWYPADRVAPSCAGREGWPARGRLILRYEGEGT